MKGVDRLKIYVDKNALQDYTTKLIAKEKTIFATKDEVGSPLVASTVAGMTDHDKIYVYVGSETGYTSGNWYYWDGAAWTSGGVYNSQGFVLDDTLTSATLPAQAKAVGDAVDQLTDNITDITGNRQIEVTGVDQYISLSGETADITSPLVSSTGYSYYVVPCSEGDVFTVSAVGGAAPRAWAFLDGDVDANILDKASNNSTVDELVLVAPENAEYLVINDKGGKKSYYGDLIKNRLLKVYSEQIDCQVYLTSGGRFGYERSGNTVTLDFGGKNVLIRLKQNASATLIEFSTIVAVATAAGWTATETTIIAPNPSCGLYYDAKNEVIRVASGTIVHTINPDYIILFECHYNSAYFGKLVDYEVGKKSEELPQIKADINTLNDQIKAQAYLSSNSHFSYYRQGNTVTLEFDGAQLMLRLKQNTTAKSFDFEAISTAAAAAGWTVNETAIVAPSPSCGMYYDLINESLVFANGTIIHSTNKDYLTLFECHYNSAYWGLLVDFETEKRSENIPELEDTVVSLAESVGDLMVPDYYKEHVEEKMHTILGNMMDVGQHGETFVFITDIHWENNRKHSPALVKYIMDSVNINLLLCGGDLINQGLREPMVEAMRECISKLSPTKNIVMPCLFGNHDSNENDYGGQGQHPERFFDRADQYALFQKQAENLVTYITDDGWNWFFDVDATKSRFIGLDTGTDGTFDEYEALRDCMIATPDGYHIVIMAHWLYTSTSGGGGAKTEVCANLETMIDAFNSGDTVTVDGVECDFHRDPEDTRWVNLLLGGHNHRDLSWATPNGVPVVLCDSDNGFRSKNTDYPYVAGTITEQAFDVFTIDYTTGDVKAVRIGRGADRPPVGGW